MAPRAVWRGSLRIAEISCPVALYAAASTGDRVSLNLLNRRTGAPLRREYVDAQTGEPVDKEDQVKGYEVATDRYVVLTPAEMASALPESDKTLRVENFLHCSDIDTTYLDRPYHIAPATAGDAPVFALIRDGLRAEKSAALARAVLFRRVRTMLIRPHGPGLIGDTLNFDYEVRPASEAFAEIPDLEPEAGLLDLARRIVRMKSGVFDPSGFDDRYDAALAEMVSAKAAGRPIPNPAPRTAPEPVTLAEALRRSAGEARRARPRAGAAAAGKDAHPPATPARPGERKSSGTGRPTRRAS